MKQRNKLAWYAWGVVLYNIAVIVFGAFVRATGSGAGCGSHWPLCNGEVVPMAPTLAMLIEYTHRITSGITVILIGGLVVWVWRVYPRGHWLRTSSAFAALFIVTESLIGAGLVLFELVAYEASATRAISMVAHLVNTFLLMASLVITAWWSTWGAPQQAQRRPLYRWLSVIGALGMLAVGASGALTALGDTLFPIGSLAEGLQQDVSPSAHLLVRLRVLHPILAILAAAFLVVFSLWLRQRIPAPALNRLAAVLSSLVGLQIVLGGMNVILLAPVWMQLVHLAVTNLIWLTFVLVLVFAWVAPDFAPGIGELEVHDGVE
jgi:heme A synthase